MKITNEDCMKLMSRYDDNHFDLAIVDPPYGLQGQLNIDTWNKKKYPKGKNKHKKIEWNKKPEKEYFTELFRVSKNQIICGANYFTEFLPISRGWIFWDKITENTFNFSAGELIFTSFDKLLKKFTKSTRNSELINIHPTQKPVKLYEWILRNYAKPGQSILDTHLGSGSIAIACHNLNFQLTACELDKEYYDAAMNRIEKHKAQGRLFA